MTTAIEYTREDLIRAIPACDPDNVGDGPRDERETFAAGFDDVLDVLRGEVPFDGTEDDVDHAVHLASDAWDHYCGSQGDTATTIAWLRAKWIPADAVVIEYMPVALRASHVKAGNRGQWPHNGAQRVAVPRALADSLQGHEWARVVPNAAIDSVEFAPYLDVDA